MRRVIGWIIGMCVLALMLHTFAVMGFVSPVYVSAGSMAPHLVGPHWDVECPVCGHHYAVGTDAPPQAGRTECPQCGSLALIGSSKPSRGDTLRVDRTTFAFRDPRRWETIVFRCPQDAKSLCVKRILGLPGETIHFDRGDVFIDGELQRKSLAEQKALRVLVQHERAAAQRWSSRLRETSWRYWGDAWRARTAGSPNAAATDDWLEFDPPHGRFVTDRLGYNAGVPAVENATGDLMLTFQLKAAGNGTVWIECGSREGYPSGEGRVVVGISPRQRAAWIGSRDQRNEEPVHRPLSAPGESLEVCLSLIDRQVLVAIDGHEEVRLPLSQPIVPATRPFAIAAAGLDVEVRNLSVWRDLMYTDRPGGPALPQGPSHRWIIGGDEYFVVGNNPALSDDSRTWRHGARLQRRLVVGRAM